MTSPRERAAALGVLLAIMCSSVTTARGATEPRTIRSPDGAAACQLLVKTIVCTNHISQARHEPISIALPGHGNATLTVRKIAWTSKTPVLSVSGRTVLGGFVCRVLQGGFFCSNAGGAAISVNRSHLAALVAPAVTP